ncbi:hypothetical protein PMIN01_06250 [Paraphaeosphaeria minitans]|uniref:Uncharacterized protein n=1 Tax=Paraphaeosphaeria minitans TaxID=565426 RepID=A0A9P6GJ42_9PLEO|nr:hypothetical protein PMIN01_06250 [Paraphaeosphaeria minitans]
MIWRAETDLADGHVCRQRDFGPNACCRAPGVNLPVTDPAPGTTVGGSLVAPWSYPARQGRYALLHQQGGLHQAFLRHEDDVKSALP